MTNLGSVGSNSTIPASALAEDVLPLGSVIDWFRASTSTTVPVGWAVCDGASWNDIDNHMGSAKTKLTSGSIPNLVGKVTVGARLTTSLGGATAADTAPSTVGSADTYANAPGIGGVGGSNAAISLAHTHTVPAHGHSDFTGFAVTGGNHGHGNNFAVGSTHNLSGGYHTHTYERSNDYNVALAGGPSQPNWQIARSSQNTGSSNVGISGSVSTSISGGVTASTSHSHGFTGSIGNAAVSGDSAITTSWFGTSGVLTDFRPAHVGLLKIMKVKIV